MNTIIFIPGHGCTPRVFEAQIQGLSAHYKCICIDLRDYKTIGEVIEYVLKNTPAQFYILGFSLGAAIALDITQQAPQRIKGHIHISLPYEGPSTTLINELTQIETDLPSMDMDEFIKLAYQKYFPHKAPNDPLYKILSQMLLETGKIHYIEQAHMLLQPWQLIASAHLHHPVLILSGALDQRAKPEYHETMAAQLKTSTRHVLPHAGHFLTVEQPALSTQIIQEWLNS
jgi:pimeloyl-ACP methyl ester carboxylesterase